VAGTSVKAVNAEGLDVTLGEPGELCVKGPQVMKGYWNRDEDTAQAIDVDGWFHTGELMCTHSHTYTHTHISCCFYCVHRRLASHRQEHVHVSAAFVVRPTN